MRWNAYTQTLLGILAAGIALSGASALAAPLFAGQITERNAAGLRLSGPDAIGGIGDWALSNGTLCAVVSDPSHESVLSTEGGVLVDLGPCTDAGDQFNLLQPLLNFSRGQIAPIEEVVPEIGPASAAIITRGNQAGVAFETRYELDLQRPRELQVTTTLRRTADGDRVFVFGDISLHGERQLSPFAISTADLDASSGFKHSFVDADDPLTMVNAIAGNDLHVLVGEQALEPQRSYGLLLRSAELIGPDGSRTPLPYLSINSQHFSLLGIFTRPFWGESPSPTGWFDLAQLLLMNLRDEERIVYRRSVLVGERADVASVTDQLWSDAPRLRGTVSDPSARIHIYRASGTPVTTVLPDPRGHFDVRLPPGSYSAAFSAPGERSAEQDFAIGAAGKDLGMVALPSATKVRLPGRDSGPMRLVFVGAPGTPDPVLGGDGRDFRVGDRVFHSATQANHVSLAGIAGDPTEITLPPGKYRVYATRGPEFSVTSAELIAPQGKTTLLAIEPPQRVLSAPGWISADLHVHSAFSDDSGLGLRDRLVAFRAQGADVIVSTEHDQVADYAPMIQEMGLAEELDSIVGVEITTTVMNETTPYSSGHSNAFPVKPRPHDYRGGAPAAEGKRLGTIMAEVRAKDPGVLVQLNHPRPSSRHVEGPKDMSLFTHLSVSEEGFDPTAPLSAAQNAPLSERSSVTGHRDLDFDAVELLNSSSMDYYRMTRADWLSLLLQGEFRTGTANSDSHRLGEVVAIPRTYVRMDVTDEGGFSEEAFISALRQGRAFGTTGPLLRATLEGRGPGERFEGDTGTLRVAVENAPWIPVNTIRIYVNGHVVQEKPTSGNQAAEFPLRFEKDSVITVEVEGEPGAIYEAVLPGFTPFAFSNPIFVDSDADGEWTAPGLVAPLPATLRDPLQAP